MDITHIATRTGIAPRQLRYVADHAQGKVIFMDSGAGASTRAVQGILGMSGETSAPPVVQR